MDSIDTTKANQARIYDYLLGGKDNYTVDREAAEQAFADYPGGIDAARKGARANRAFLGRAVHWLAADAGVRQFLDIGTGIPTAGNTHQIAQEAAPGSRVVYVDKDPVVLAHARALLVSGPDGVTKYVDSDLRDPDEILRRAAEVLDFDKPVAVLLVFILHMIDDDDDPYRIVRRLVDAVPSGSYLVMSHGANDGQHETSTVTGSLRQRMAEPVHLRSHAEVSRFFDGLEFVVTPGLVQPQQWQVGGGGVARDVTAHCGVARKP